MDALGRLATDVTGELQLAIRDTRAVMAQNTRSPADAERLVAASPPRVEEALDQLAGSLERTDRMLADPGPRVAPLSDRLMAVLADTRRTLTQVHRLAQTANSLAGENRSAISETVQHLHHSSVPFEHFADQVRRRPTRLRTGVEPPSLDTNPKRP